MSRSIEPLAPAAAPMLLILAFAASTAWAQSDTAQSAAPGAAGQGAPTAQNAPAPQGAAAGEGALQEVVVTARYRTENLQQTPIAITAITSEDIQARGFTNSSDIALSVPSAVFRPAQQAFGNTQTAYIRGIGQFDFNFAFEPGVGIYVDDVYYPTTMASQFDLLDIADVEVLRGPQGTLFGRGAIGGAVLYKSKQPKGDNTGFIETTVGEFHRVDVRAGFDVSLIPDKLFMRVTGVSRKQDGYQRDFDYACLHSGDGLAGSLPALERNRLAGCVLGTLGGTDVQGARAMFRFVASDTIDIGVIADYQRDDSEARADTLMSIVTPFGPGVAAWDALMFQKYGVHYDNRFLPPNPYITYDTFNDPYSGLSFPPRTALNQKGISGTVDWKLSDAVQAKLIVAWRNWNGSFATDQDGSPLGFSVVDGLQEFTYRTAELRFNGGLLDNKLQWTLGGFYYLGGVRSAQSVELPAFMPPVSPTNPTFGDYASDPTGTTNGIPNSLLVNGLDHGSFQNASAFLHTVYAFTDALHLELGARFSNDKKSDLNDNSIVVQTVSTEHSRGDWLASLDYRFTDSVMGYVKAATGYRPPAYNPRPFQASQFVPVAGESLVSYEVGLKGDFLDHRLRIDPTAYYSDYKQRILPASGSECLKNPDGSVIPGPNPNPEGGPSCAVVGIPLTAYLNAPGKIYGGELEMEVRPIPALLLSANAGYTRTGSDTVIFEQHPFNGITPSGEFAEVPRWTASATAQYVFELPNGGTITPRWDSYYNSEICADAPNAATGYTALTSCAGGFVLHNARIEYADKDRNWTVAVGATNITDKFYWLNIFDVAGFGEPTVEGQPSQPRAWYFTVQRNFH